MGSRSNPVGTAVSGATIIILVQFADFFTPIDGGGDWLPISTSRVAIGD